jgi:hypothetical protein
MWLKVPGLLKKYFMSHDKELNPLVSAKPLNNILKRAEILL